MSNFKDIRSDIAHLKADPNNKFHAYLHRLMHTSSDSIFYKYYVLHYVNILHHLDHDLVTHNNRIECIKTALHMKCRNFISGLHILAKNQIPESILHADVFSNILRGVSHHLLKDNVCTLLYCISVNPYYSMNIVKSFILNNVLYMTISLPLKHHREPIMSLYGCYSYQLTINMSDEKSVSSSYDKLQISYPYLLLSDDQFALLDDNFDSQVIQYYHMYVQTEPILLFRRSDRNCYINIIEHAPAKTIISTCTFLYYHKISVHATLVTTSHFFYLLNIYDELKITCGIYSQETKCYSYSVSIIKCTDACDCVIQSMEIQLIGSHYNCSSNGNCIIYHIFNFVTEWLHNKKVMPYYRENEHILRLPSSASILSLNVVKSNSSDVFTENKVPAISLQQLDTLISNLKQNKIYLSNSDKLGQDNALFNESIMENMDNTDDLLDIDSWFDEDAESSMIFNFVSCIIALLAFILLLFLCFKHERLRKLMSLYIISPVRQCSYR